MRHDRQEDRAQLVQLVVLDLLVRKVLQEQRDRLVVLEQREQLVQRDLQELDQRS